MLTLPAQAAPALPAIGQPFGGGFFVGLSSFSQIDPRPAALIVAPKALGEIILPWATYYGETTPGTQSLFDGLANTEALNDDRHPLAQWARRLIINGLDDWHIPARDDLELCFRNLKPGTDENETYASRLDVFEADLGEYNGVDENGNGHNASSTPPGSAYSEDNPSQTLSPLFQTGGSEAFEPAWHASSTEFSPNSFWAQNFADGNQDYYYKDFKLRCRVLRKVLI